MDNQKAYAKMIAKAWSDESFKQKLLENPRAACEELGLQLPKNCQLYVHENTNNKVHLVIPQRPEGEFSESDLEKISAGNCRVPVDGLG